MVAQRVPAWLLGLFLAFLGVCLLGYVGHKVRQLGYKEGLTDYHNMCYNGGPGFIIVEGKVVLCGPGGQLSEHEQKELDSRVKV